MLTENRILRLRRDLSRIYKLKNEILELSGRSKNADALRKIPEMLRRLDSIASRAEPRNGELDSFIREARLRLVGTNLESSPDPAVEHEIQALCDRINSIAFDFTEEGVRILIRKSKQRSSFRKRKLI